MKTTYYVATSLDGFIADEDGGVAWLDPFNTAEGMKSYEQFIAGIDGLVMGRTTYDMIASFGTWPYKDLPTWVITSRSIEAMDGCKLQGERTHSSAIAEAKGLGLSHLWCVGGGRLATALLQAGHLSHLSIAQIPVVIGRGIPLFETHDGMASYKLLGVRTDAGFAQMEYELSGSAVDEAIT